MPVFGMTNVHLQTIIMAKYQPKFIGLTDTFQGPVFP